MDNKTRKEMISIILKLYNFKFTDEQILDIVYVLYPDNRRNTLRFIIEDNIDMLKSFDTAVDIAGGRGFYIEDLLKMTFTDLLSSLAPNGIRFYCNKTHKLRKK